jgi:hypothetical protein
MQIMANGGEHWRRRKWRKGWDSNPRGSVNPLPVFKTGALNHSATLPSFKLLAFHFPQFAANLICCHFATEFIRVVAISVLVMH